MSKRGKNFKYYKPQAGKSFTGFASSYPGGLSGHRISYSEKMRRRNMLKWVFIAIGAVAVFSVGFVVTNIMLDIARRPIDTQSPSQTAQATVPATEPGTEPVTNPGMAADEIRSLWAGTGILNGGTALQDFISHAKSSSANAVVIDFKDESGNLCYTTALTSVADASANARTAVKESIKALQNSGIAVIARINCFKDPLAANAMRAAAVHYKGNSGWLWLDAKKGGQPWLNPFSLQAKEYLLGIVEEVDRLGVDYILLDAVRFPRASLRSATFDGENAPGALSRNGVLIDFVNSAVKAADSAKIICAMSADAVINGSSTQYDGNLWNCTPDIFAIDFRGTVIPAGTVFPEGKSVIVIVNKAAGTAGKGYIIQ